MRQPSRPQNAMVGSLRSTVKPTAPQQAMPLRRECQLTQIIHQRVGRNKQPEAVPERKVAFRTFVSRRRVFQRGRGLRSSGKGLRDLVPAYVNNPGLSFFP